MKIRPLYDCRPMERGQRRIQYVRRFFSDAVWPLFVRQAHDHDDMMPSQSQTMSGEFEDRPIQVSQHGRLEVSSHSVRMLRPPSIDVASSSDEEGDESQRRIAKERETTQFRLTNRKSQTTLADSVLSALGIRGSGAAIYDDPSGNDTQCSCCGFEPNTFVARYLHWTLRQSFMTVFFSTTIGFFLGTLIFAFLLLWCGRSRPECLRVGGQDFGNGTDSSFYRDFGDAYQLSWTNFATVVCDCIGRMIFRICGVCSLSHTTPCISGLWCGSPSNISDFHKSRPMRFRCVPLFARSIRWCPLWQFLWSNYVW